MPTRNVQLTDHSDNFIASSVNTGRYSDASEVVREALSLLEQREQEETAKVTWLRNAVQDGLDALNCGEYVTCASPADLAKHIRALGEEASQDLAPTAQRD